MKQVREGGYANLAMHEVLSRARPTSGDAAFATELVFGTCRHLGTLDTIIEHAASRPISSLQPGVVDVLRLGAEQMLAMAVPAHAAVSTSVDLAAAQIGRRVTAVVNAILRRVSAHDWSGWMDEVTRQSTPEESMAIRSCHPAWIVRAYSEVVPTELPLALAANNIPATPTLVVRPGLMSRQDLIRQARTSLRARPPQSRLGGGEGETQSDQSGPVGHSDCVTATVFSPWGVRRPGDPGEVEAVRTGFAGVQDEGSQLVAGVVARVDAPPGPWLDMCAGPGGKTALLLGLARERGERVVAADLHPHRARLVSDAIRAYGETMVMAADGRSPAWGQSFSRVVLDAPCTGLGALRRRSEARWRKGQQDLSSLTALQRELLRSACRSVAPGGVVAYITCSPHVAETAEVVAAVVGEGDVDVLDAPALLPNVPEAEASTDPRFIQLWPHRHGTDAMFCALLRKRPR
jgi:16S rRNA (cytosine967-C5)-methyltransferase